MAAEGKRSQRAKTAPVHAPGARGRILRIGVLLGGKIVEERLIRERAPVSIGQSMKNTFSIPVDGLPLEFTMFAIEDGKYYLQFLPKMDGRLGDGGTEVRTLDALKRNGAQQVGGHWRVPLGESARGKLSLGDLTVLFQLVVEPPRQPKPMLPAAVYGNFMDRFDPQLLVILAISLFAHMGTASFAWWRDVEEDSIAERAYNLTFKQDTYEVEVVKPEPESTATGSAAGSAAKPEKATDPKPKTVASASKPGAGRSEKEDVATTEEDANKYADLLVFNGPNGTATSDMNTRRPGSNLSQEINDIREGNKPIGEDGFGNGRTSRDNGGPRPGTDRGLQLEKTDGVERIAGGKTTERVPSGRIKVSSKSTDDDSDLSPDAVMRRITSAYMAGIKRCYTNFLKKEASARGAVKLSFEVNPTGRALNGRAAGFADEVDACITSLMATWRFPIPKDKDGEPTSAGFSITLQLLPE